MQLIAITTNLRLQDILDILFLTIVAYHLYIWFRETKALKALVGLFVMGFVFTIAEIWGLFLTTWVFQIFWQVLIILIIILFQSEIRKVLERVNPLQALGFHKPLSPDKWVPTFAKGVFALAKRKIGALIIIERKDRVKEFITEGQPLKGEPNIELLMCIFQKDSPLHDGAVLIQDDRIIHAASYLPLSSAEGLPKEWGTRHRAALGLSERCDALVVVVSEERGEVSLARGGNLLSIGDQEALLQLIQESLANQRLPQQAWWKKISSFIVNRWPAKAGSLFLVCFMWLMLAGQQDFEATINVPVHYSNIPQEMQLVEPEETHIQIVVRGLRKDASTLNEKNVSIDLDLSLASLGRRTFTISRDQIKLPYDSVYVVRINPTQLKLQFKK
ncbi:MAG: diadenylate cyclase CdaA [Deltaproteobacteria bacterium]|nr:diadenylate cyclase CdaA [Deltaproteobacteria bacterium]